ncbi:MAG TPA: 7-carboxy-7-deazaguanine synthase QueE [Candidatus Omnitrophota bacterium]|nr:7-carboxy-7-deazaguanine synthase QueE [Candidatus Omnitrophota bacterium]
MHKKTLVDKSIQTEISEVFSSLQGEGPYLGVKQIFVRFGRCNMHCGYCDELDKMAEGKFKSVSMRDLLDDVMRLEKEKGEHHSVSLTGGEPLFYTPFLKNFLPKLKEKGFITYLEANGTLPRELGEVIRYCDIIAMDLKPASSTGDRAFWRQHESFLKIAIQKDVFVKVVVTPGTLEEDIARCVNLVRSVNPALPFIFQPLSDPFGINAKALALIEGSFFSLAKSSLHNVRVIPQMHKIWGVR